MEIVGVFILGLVVVALVAAIGAAGGAWLTLRVAEHMRRRVVVEVEAHPITARVTAPAEVAVPVRLILPKLDPITVPIVTAPAPSVRELAERIVAAVPDIGPSALAMAVGCSKSTAHGILQDLRGVGRGGAVVAVSAPVVALPMPTFAPVVAAPELDREELDVWLDKSAFGDTSGDLDGSSPSKSS